MRRNCRDLLQTVAAQRDPNVEEMVRIAEASLTVLPAKINAA